MRWVFITEIWYRGREWGAGRPGPLRGSVQIAMGKQTLGTKSMTAWVWPSQAAITSGHHKWPLTLGPWRIGSYGILRIRETDLEEMPALCRAIDGLVEVIAPRLCHMTSKSLPNPCLTPGDA